MVKKLSAWDERHLSVLSLDSRHQSMRIKLFFSTFAIYRIVLLNMRHASQFHPQCPYLSTAFLQRSKHIRNSHIGYKNWNRTSWAYTTGIIIYTDSLPVVKAVQNDNEALRRQFSWARYSLKVEKVVLSTPGMAGNKLDEIRICYFTLFSIVQIHSRPRKRDG